MSSLVARRVPAAVEQRLAAEGLHPVLARLYAARGVTRRAELDDAFAELLPPAGLLGIDRAAARLADAVERGERILIVADYDCDGATACAVGLRALRAFGADAGYLVPDRIRFGYGLTPELVAVAATLAPRPALIVTVDNGIASVEGVAAARTLGIDTVVTDHHLPGAVLPEAAAIVNPNQPGCGFASKAIAGVGVMFYVMLALRAELRARGRLPDPEPALADLLDLVALGTVADVVRLDRNNRILVSQGLRRMRAGRMQPGLRALFAVAGRDPARAAGFDLGFTLGPRINAAGRLSDMSVGIECLTTDDTGRAMDIARTLDDFNRERRAIEAGMREQAEALIDAAVDEARVGVSLFDPRWHAGVVGIVAGRMKDRLHRPVIAFAGIEGTDELRGSGRSIPGLHLRDAIDLVAKREPGLIERFGGHAAAAGLTIPRVNLERFTEAFDAAVRELATPEDLRRVVETDGSLETGYANLATARLLESGLWGQGFPQPLFCDAFDVVNQRVVGERHLKLKLQRDGQRFEAMHFNAESPAPPSLRAAYRLTVNEWNGVQNVQLVMEHIEPA